MDQAVSLRDLYAQYNEAVQFIVIYIREAHAVDGFYGGGDHGITDPKTIQERREVAGACEAAMAYGIRTYVDEIEDPVMTAYAAWPERLYLVGTDRRVVYKGGRGPAGFKPSELKDAIDGLLAGTPQ